MKKIFLIAFFLICTKDSLASIKENIISKLTEVENISFEFEQNINGKIESGNCIIEYPRKINCKYNSSNKKILISNGKSLVIKTLSSYYIYPLKKTPLNTILDKDFLLKKIKKVGKSIVLEFKIENKFSKYLIPKASILINGVSLTISKIKGNNFQIWCIPHTLKLTNLSNLKVNDIVNIEIDILSKYVKKFYENKKV